MTHQPAADQVPLLPWWQEWDQRLEQELDRFTQRGLEVRLVEDPREGAGRLSIETTITLPEGPTRIQVVYPDGFPHRRFNVFAPDLHLPRHQAPGGNLCVFPRDSRYWHPKYMAADVVADDVPALVELVRHGGETLRREEDPQGEPVTAYYGGTVHGGIIVDERAADLPFETGDGGMLTASFTAEGLVFARPPDVLPDDWVNAIGQGFLLDLRDRNGAALLASPPLDNLAARFVNPIEGRWIHLSNPPFEQHTPAELWATAMSADTELARWAESHTGPQLVGVNILEEVRQGVLEPAWFFLFRDLAEAAPTRTQLKSGNPAVRNARHVTGSRPQTIRALRWTPEDLSARVPELAPLRDKTVAVIGLGSLGAPVVQELAKSRIGELRLADFDHIDPGTSVRHPLGLTYAGRLKTHALGRWVVDHNPEVQVQINGVNVGSAFPEDDSTQTEREMLQQFLTGADLFVGATAEQDVNRQLDAMALKLDVPRLYLWSQSGYGGVVALLRAGATGCFHCLSLYLSARSAAGDHVVQVPPDEDGQPPGTIQGRGCAAKTFIASHADLLPIAVQAARVAYAHLCGDAAGGYPKFNDDVFAVQIREPDGRPIPPRWTAFKLPRDPECPICHPS